MPTLPIPAFGALVLVFLVLRLWITERRLGPLAYLVGFCALQLGIISLAQHYQIAGMRPVQPVTASAIPPLAWIAFVTTAVRSFQSRDLVHLAGPLTVTLLLVVAPDGIDLLIPGLFVGYGAALLWAGRASVGALPKMRLEEGDVPLRVWQIIGAVLIASALSDGMILSAQVMGAGHLQPWIISFYSAANLLLLGALGLSGPLNSYARENGEEAPDTTALDSEIMARLDALMRAETPYLEPGLTLSKLSRRLMIPSKQLSAAINRATGENVSRYINNARIGAAQEMLVEGETVINAMLASGFNTKSNFNREFLRVAGCAPTEWRAEHTTRA